jgi:hypothetical protein
VIFKELPFIIECLADGLIRFNVALATVDDRDVTQTKGDDATRQNIDNIGPSIPGIENISHRPQRTAARYLHEVNFCEDADGSGPFRVDFSGQF